MGKGKVKKAAWTGGHKMGPVLGRDYFMAETGTPRDADLDVYRLYQDAVQAPNGEVAAFLKFYRQYVGPEAPTHLREDFCGTAHVAATWCRGDVRRTAVGLDLDQLALHWGLSHNVHSQDLGHRLALFHGDVLSSWFAARPVLGPSTTGDGRSGLADGPSMQARIAGEAEKSTDGLDEEGQNVCPASESVEHPPDRNDSATQGSSQPPFSAGPGALPRPADEELLHLRQTTKQEVTAGGLQPDHAADLLHLEGEDHGTGQQPRGPEGAVSPVDFQGYYEDPLECFADDVLQYRDCSVVCALNFSVCLLHLQKDVARYFKDARSAFWDSSGGIFVIDLLGGPNAETSLNVIRRNEVTRAEYGWEQLGFDPVTRMMHAYLSLRDQATRQTVRRAFHYHWRLWTIPELSDRMLAAGFDDVKAWLRPMADEQGVEREGGNSSFCVAGEERSEAPASCGVSNFVEYKPGTDMTPFQRGWTAYLIGVVRPSDSKGTW